MTTYFRTADGGIVSNHDISRAYKATEQTVPFHEFQTDWLYDRGARRDNHVTVDDLILSGQIKEAIYRFREMTGCTYDRAKNAVYTLKDAFRC